MAFDPDDPSPAALREADRETVRAERAMPHPAAGVRPRASSLARAGTAAWYLIGIAAVVLLAGWAAGRLMPVLLPLGIAILLTTILRPLAARLEQRGLPPAAAATVTLVALVAIAGVLVYAIVPPFVDRLSDLGTSVEQGARQIAYTIGHDALGMDHAAVDQTFDDIVGGLRGHLGGVTGAAVTGATTVVGIAAGIVLVLFLSFFLVKDGARVWAWLVRLVPLRHRDDVREMGERSWEVLGGYMRGVVFVATIDAVFIGLALVLVGVPLTLPLIVLTWLAAFIPIVGAVTAGLAAVLVTLVADGLGSALIVLAAIVAVQQLEGNVLYPVVVGRRLLKLHPVVVLLAVAAGGTIAGLPGAFLGVPVATVAATVLDYLRKRPRDPAPLSGR